MRHKVHFKCMDKAVTIEHGETILEASVRACLRVDYGCSNGNCGLCSARLVNGEIEQTQHYDYCFSTADKCAGRFLMCTNTAVSDLVITTDITAPSARLEARSLLARVRTLKRLNDNVCALTLQTPRSRRLRFLAGQYARLQSQEAGCGRFSIASCPCDERRLEFHIPRRPHMFSRYIFERCDTRDILQITAPYGEFTFAGNLSRPLVLIAFGIGFAPVKSLIEHIIAQEAETPVHLYQIDAPGQHYLTNLCRSWSDALDQVEYHTLDIGYDVNEGATAARCVSEIVYRYRNTLSNADVYCCAPAAAGQAIDQATAVHLPVGWRLFYEPIRDRMTE